jgi:hypothetical protein
VLANPRSCFNPCENPINAVQAELFGIERFADPLRHSLVLGMLWIGQDFEQIDSQGWQYFIARQMCNGKLTWKEQEAIAPLRRTQTYVRPQRASFRVGLVSFRRKSRTLPKKPAFAGTRI